MSLRFHIVLVLSIMCLTAAGCYPSGPISIITYDRHSPSNEDFQSLARDKSSMSYEVALADDQRVHEACERYHGAWGCRVRLDLDTDKLRSVLNDTFIQRGTLPNATYSLRRPEQGTHLRVEIWRELFPPPPFKATDAQNLRIFLYLITLGVVPIQVEWSHNIRYTLYIDNEVKLAHTYTIKRQDFDSILLLPFVWMNFLTPSKRDAFESTAYEFLLDAQRQGFLQGTGEGMEPTEKR